MDRRFLVESKSFVLSVLDGASVSQVEEKWKGFFGDRDHPEQPVHRLASVDNGSSFEFPW
jgi:hypothetical protein